MKHRRFQWICAGVGSLFLLLNLGCHADKTVTTVDALWPAYTFYEAIEEAETIVYGKVVDKGTTQIEEHVIGEDKTFKEYYRDVTIEVIEMLKGDEESATVNYIEMGGETSTQVTQYSGVVPVSAGDRVILFLRENGSYICPDGLFTEDEEGMITVPQNMMPQTNEMALEAENRCAVAEYCEWIRNTLA